MMSIAAPPPASSNASLSRLQSSSSRNPTTIAQSLLKIDETGFDLWKRLTPVIPFQLRISPDKIEQVAFGQMIEVLAKPTEVAELVLSTALEYADQFHRTKDAVIIHISLGSL
jgi:tellurite resistance protein